MKFKFEYWLDVDKSTGNKTLIPINGNKLLMKWKKVGDFPAWIYCHQNDWTSINLYNNDPNIITDEEKREHIIGRAVIKEKRGGTKENLEGAGTQAIKKLFELEPWFIEEHPTTSKEFFERSNHWKFAPRFENLVEGIFENVWKIDIKACYANIMRDYPLPCGEVELITGSLEIEGKLKEGATGFVSFYTHRDAIIKNKQIPFLPDIDDSESVPKKIRVRHLLHTKLLKAFQRQYEKKGKLIYKNFWVFKEKKGCVNKFLDYCEELKKVDKDKGKLFSNALYGYFGKNEFSGYHYHPFHLAVNHLAILKTYYLCREFKKENVLAIRVDCIYVKGELPERILKEKDKYHIDKLSKVGFRDKEFVFTYDTEKLLARRVSKEEREKLKTEFLEWSNQLTI